MVSKANLFGGANSLVPPEDCLEFGGGSGGGGDCQNATKEKSQIGVEESTNTRSMSGHILELQGK